MQFQNVANVSNLIEKLILYGNHDIKHVLDGFYERDCERDKIPGFQFLSYEPSSLKMDSPKYKHFKSRVFPQRKMSIWRSEAYSLDMINRLVSKHVDRLQRLIHQHQSEPGRLCVTETWFSSD